MTINEKLKYDRIIAEFMGGKVIKTETHESLDSPIEIWKTPKGIPQYDDSASIGYFRYYSDWNRLMTVIEEIESLNYTFVIGKNTATIARDLEVILYTDSDNKLDACLQAVVDFIKYFEELKVEPYI
jgi:hypothetical protein